MERRSFFRNLFSSLAGAAAGVVAARLPVEPPPLPQRMPTAEEVAEAMWNTPFHVGSPIRELSEEHRPEGFAIVTFTHDGRWSANVSKNLESGWEKGEEDPGE